MFEALIRNSLNSRILVLALAVCMIVFGIFAFKNLSVDAFPDVTNVQVQIATESRGRSPEEVERFITAPLEIAMTGLPNLTEMRSLNKNGLSLITLVFTDETDVYFARQLVMERLIEVSHRMPDGINPILGPVSTGLGEVYQYTLERSDDGNRALSTDELMRRREIQDWVLRPLLRSIAGVAEINSQGGYNKQYQILINPDRLFHYQITSEDVLNALTRNNANSGGGVLPHYAEQYLIRGVGLIRDIKDIENIVPYLGRWPVFEERIRPFVKQHELGDHVFWFTVDGFFWLCRKRRWSCIRIVQLVHNPLIKLMGKIRLKFRGGIFLEGA